MSRTAPACVLGWLLSGGYVSAAATATPPQLLFRDCTPRDAADINRLVMIDAASSTARADLASTTVAVLCRDGRFDVQVTASRGRTTGRSIDLQQTAPSARTRLVAIAVVELLAASQSLEPSSTTPPPSGLAVAAPAREAAPVDVPRPAACCAARAEAVGSVRAFYGGVTLAGGGVRAVFGRSFPLSLDLLAEHGSQRATEGAVSVFLLTLGATYGVDVVLGAARLHAGAGARGGLSRLTGRADDATMVQGVARNLAWGGPMLDASVTWVPLGSLVLELALEAGYPVVAVYAGSELPAESGAPPSSRRELGLHGGWIAAKVGIGFGQ